MTQQTAVEWLEIQLKKQGFLYDLDINAAKQMEKEQKIEFAKFCLDKALDLDIRTAHCNVEKYYNETYENK